MPKKVASQSRVGCDCISGRPHLCMLKEPCARLKSPRCSEHLTHNLHLDNHHGFHTEAHQALYRPVRHDLGLWSLFSEPHSSSSSFEKSDCCRAPRPRREMARIRTTGRRRLSISVSNAQCNVRLQQMFSANKCLTSFQG